MVDKIAKLKVLQKKAKESSQEESSSDANDPVKAAVEAADSAMKEAGKIVGDESTTAETETKSAPKEDIVKAIIPTAAPEEVEAEP